ncbi:membrane protease HflC [Pseudomonas sp. NZIPFR-PS2]|nr:membrane protease HflC [Pseudomonas sp. NZIPFR-PS2]
MSNKSLTALIVGVVVVIAAWNCFYIVAQTERAVLLQFGRVVQADVQPGLHVKVPYVNQVRKFDARLMTLDAPTQRFLTLEKKAVMVDAYAKWRVKDAERFYTATSGLKQIADERLSRRLESGLRDQFGKRTLHEVVSGERDALMADITRSLNTMAEKELGIEVVDVRNELAEGIRADADRQRRVLLAEAYRESEEARGDGDAQAAAIYAKAYGQDQEFYAFYRSLRAYRESFANKTDVMVLDPSSDFFRYLEKSK